MHAAMSAATSTLAASTVSRSARKMVLLGEGMSSTTWVLSAQRKVSAARWLTVRKDPPGGAGAPLAVTADSHQRRKSAWLQFRMFPCMTAAPVLVEILVMVRLPTASTHTTD